MLQTRIERTHAFAGLSELFISFFCRVWWEIIACDIILLIPPHRPHLALYKPSFILTCRCNADSWNKPCRRSAPSCRPRSSHPLSKQRPAPSSTGTSSASMLTTHSSTGWSLMAQLDLLATPCLHGGLLKAW